MDFICQFDMSYYPFDTQTCQAIFAMKGNTGYFVKLVPENLTNLGPKDMMQYQIKHITFVKSVSNLLLVISLSLALPNRTL